MKTYRARWLDVLAATLTDAGLVVFPCLSVSHCAMSVPPRGIYAAGFLDFLRQNFLLTVDDVIAEVFCLISA